MALAQRASDYVGELAVRRFVFGDEPIPKDYLAWVKSAIEESLVPEDNGGGPRCPQPTNWLSGDRANVLGSAEFDDESVLDVLQGAVFAW